MRIDPRLTIWTGEGFIFQEEITAQSLKNRYLVRHGAILACYNEYRANVAGDVLLFRNEQKGSPHSLPSSRFRKTARLPVRFHNAHL